MSLDYETQTGGPASFPKQPTVLLLAPLYPPAYRGGGPIRTTEAMVEKHGDRFRFHVITSNTDWGESTPLDVETDRWVTRGKARVIYTKKRSIVSLFRALREGAKLKPDFVHINGLLSPDFSIFPLALSRLGCFSSGTVIYAPRGGLGDAALSIKPRKKKFYLCTSRLTGLHSRVTWHASSAAEALEIRRHRPKAQVAVRLNESNLPKSALRSKASCTQIVRIIYVSRISEIKGLKLLLEALAEVTTNVIVDIFGSANDPIYLEHCRARAATLSSNINVTFHGSVENSRVRELFAKADAFFLPTEQENFGHAIAESLSAGCPTFVEDVTPWTEVISRGGGKIVGDHTVAAWRAALQEYCTLPPVERTEMKKRAADAYEEWRSNDSSSSIFDLVANRQFFTDEEMLSVHGRA